MKFFFFLRTAFAAGASAVVQVSGRSMTSSCPKAPGNFTIERNRLYPENLDFDSHHCKLYLGYVIPYTDLPLGREAYGHCSANFDGYVLVYDPWNGTQKIIEIPGVTGVSPYHISGIDFDNRTGMMYFAANSGLPFETSGANLTGPNQLVQYDTNTETLGYIINMESFQQEVLQSHSLFVTGFQDMDEDEEGNVYFLATYGGAVAKVSPLGIATPFYVAQNANESTSWSNGISIIGDKALLFDETQAALISLDLTETSPAAINVPVSGLPTDETIDCDGLYIPPKYDERVLLCSSDGLGKIIVFRTEDGWETASFAGGIVNTITDGWATASVQISNSIYMNEEYFFDTGVWDQAGNRTLFPIVDITSRLESILS